MFTVRVVFLGRVVHVPDFHTLGVHCSISLIAGDGVKGLLSGLFWQSRALARPMHCRRWHPTLRIVRGRTARPGGGGASRHACVARARRRHKRHALDRLDQSFWNAGTRMGRLGRMTWTLQPRERSSPRVAFAEPVIGGPQSNRGTDGWFVPFQKGVTLANFFGSYLCAFHRQHPPSWRGTEHPSVPRLRCGSRTRVPEKQRAAMTVFGF